MFEYTGHMRHVSSAAAHCGSAVASVAVLIPAYQPDRRLLLLVRSLLELSFPAIIVVDDGSGSGHAWVFEELAKDSRTCVLRHPANLGKGRALKTGLSYFLTHFPAFSGVVTCDADGQHAPEDVAAAAGTLESSPSKLVIGSRRFSGSVPLRSRLGNSLTRYVFALSTGRLLSDTQSGLRAMPRQMIPRLLELAGDRYEYEMNVLAEAAGTHGLVEVPIQTIYLDGNRSSHFSPVWDSMKIYFVLLRFGLSSLLAAGIDFIVFTAVFWATGNLLASLITGRVSSLVNFFLNRGFVFASRGAVASALLRYYALVVVVAAASYSGIAFLTQHAGMQVLPSKLWVESFLWLVSFSMQRAFVFRRRQEPRAHLLDRA